LRKTLDIFLEMTYISLTIDSGFMPFFHITLSLSHVHPKSRS